MRTRILPCLLILLLTSSAVWALEPPKLTERVMDLADGLPKFAALPPDFGGTGETVAEAGQTGWRA